MLHCFMYETIIFDMCKQVILFMRKLFISIIHKDFI